MSKLNKGDDGDNVDDNDDSKRYFQIQGHNGVCHCKWGTVSFIDTVSQTFVCLISL